MAEYFTSEHFKLLNKWKGHKWDASVPEQVRANDELKRAYEVTEQWAKALRDKYFPNGRPVVIRKAPISQGQKFLGYNWARIYPSQDAPEQLAYTVGIDANLGFIVKIDTVAADPALRSRYERLYGISFSRSPIAATLPASEGLSKSLPELVDWSIEAIRGFAHGYEEVAAQLQLREAMSDAELLKRFDGNEGFRSLRAAWSPEDQALFCRLVRAIHAAGLDCWHTRQGRQVRFGRKNAGSERASGLLGIVHVTRVPKVSWLRDLAGLGPLHLERATEDLCIRIENVLQAEQPDLDHWLGLDVERPGFWPDELREDPADPNEDEEESGGAPAAVTRRPAVNRIYYGPPGTGKTYALQQELDALYTDATTGERRYSFVTFHQSYGYEEFIEGLRPVLGVNASSGQVRYEIRPGAFRELCRKARLHPDQQFAMVIDEINRGNVSKIFGELITLIELDKRDPLDGTRPPAEVALAYSGDSFSVPANIDVIGTMNTADRSLALVDTALRRRFEFVPRMPDTRDVAGAPLHGLTIAVDGRDIDVRRMLHRMNERIEALYDRDHTIGHAYFTPLVVIPNGPARFTAFTGIFRTRILPLLEEYFFEDWQKIRLVLADHQKSGTRCFVTASEDQEGELSELFGSGHGLDTFNTKRRFALQEEAFTDPDAYIGIYAGVVQ